MNIHTGQCLCGKIKYEVKQIGSKIGHCHCTMCRKFHGAAFSTFAEAKMSDFHWLQGDIFLHTYTADNGTKRKFCQNCGSSLIFESASESHDVIEFSLATLDQPPMLTPDAHIYLSTKVSWLELSDDLPKYLNGRE